MARRIRNSGETRVRFMLGMFLLTILAYIAHRLGWLN